MRMPAVPDPYHNLLRLPDKSREMNDARFGMELDSSFINNPAEIPMFPTERKLENFYCQHWENRQFCHFGHDLKLTIRNSKGHPALYPQLALKYTKDLCGQYNLSRHRIRWLSCRYIPGVSIITGLLVPQPEVRSRRDRRQDDYLEPGLLC